VLTSAHQCSPMSLSTMSWSTGCQRLSTMSWSTGCQRIEAASSCSRQAVPRVILVRTRKKSSRSARRIPWRARSLEDWKQDLDQLAVSS
jgi:hypothetical protein